MRRVPTRRVLLGAGLVLLVVLAGCLSALGTVPSGHGKPRGCPMSISTYGMPGFHRAFQLSYESGPSMNGFFAVHENGTLVGTSGLVTGHDVASDGGPRIDLAGHPTGIHTYAVDFYVDTHLNGHYDAKDASCGMRFTVTHLFPTWGRLSNGTATVAPTSPSRTSVRRYSAALTRNTTIRAVAISSRLSDRGTRNLTVRVVEPNGTERNATRIARRRHAPFLTVGRFAAPVRAPAGSRVVVTHRAPNPSSPSAVRASLIVNPRTDAFATNVTLSIPPRPTGTRPSVSFDGHAFPAGSVRVKGRFPGRTRGFVVVSMGGDVVGHTALFGAKMSTYHDLPVRVDLRNGTYALSVTVYRDANGDGRFDGADVPYRVDGTAVGTTGRITVGKTGTDASN